MTSGSFFVDGDDESPVKVRAHVVFEGLVQGVFFRANTKRCAESYGLTGWVRNMADGRVEAVFEGEEEAVRAAIDWCVRKQPLAKVDRHHVEFSEATGEFDSFTVRYGPPSLRER